MPLTIPGIAGDCLGVTEGFWLPALDGKPAYLQRWGTYYLHVSLQIYFSMSPSLPEPGLLYLVLSQGALGQRLLPHLPESSGSSQFSLHRICYEATTLARCY